jgi:hypothetical protein
MEDKEQIADMLLKNGLAPTREYALMLAEKFQSMDQNSSAEYSESNMKISSIHPVSYEEDVMMNVSAPSFTEARNESATPRPETRQMQQSQPDEAQRRLHATKVDISEFFNVNNMKKK